MSATLTRHQYVDVLLRFYRVVSAWDRWADANVPEDLRQVLTGRRRAALLSDDLQAMGAAVPVALGAEAEKRMSQAAAGDARSVFLGRMYVMEGSTLGGQYIARHVEEVLGLQRGQGNSYFAGYGEGTGQRWREFKAILADLPDSETETVIHSAKNMFDIFGETMREDLPNPPAPYFPAGAQGSATHHATDREHHN